jgi:GMP synthase PP-ATPase subunit
LKPCRELLIPEQKREAITQTFYKKVFGRIVRESGARYLLQGTILTDVDETVAGIKVSTMSSPSWALTRRRLSDTISLNR